MYMITVTNAGIHWLNYNSDILDRDIRWLEQIWTEICNDWVI